MLDAVKLLALGAIISMPVHTIRFASPLVLRWRHPSLRGPFRIPGGWPAIIPMKLVPSAIAASPIASAFREKLIGAVGFIGAAPFVYWAAQSSQAGQGRLFSAGIFKL